MKRLRTITFLVGLGVLLALAAGCPAPGSGGTDSIPPGTTVYVAGRYYIGTGPAVPCYWANGVRTDLLPGGRLYADTSIRYLSTTVRSMRPGIYSVMALRCPVSG
jgi:hypothetical protein